MSTGKFTKVFPNFRAGLVELMGVSFSAAQTISSGGNPLNESDGYVLEARVVGNLAANVAQDRPTGNGVGWGRCKIAIDAGKVSYTTVGGLQFGWEVDSSDYQDSPEWDTESQGKNRWTFWIRHPKGNQMPAVSNLANLARTFGWTEIE